MSGVLVIGAGFAGLGAAARLVQAGVQDVVVLERGSDVGGTWRDNTYPGAACDIPSLLYSYSWAQNPDWSRVYSGGEEILAYVHHIVDTFDLRRLITFGAHVTGLTWDDGTATWTASCADGRVFAAQSVVMASGPLANASLPPIRGIDTFRGEKVHSARWGSADLAGKRVAVVGTGASAVQIVPELVKQCARVTVFQRTPGWVVPRTDLPTPGWSRALFGRLPLAQSVAREALLLAHETAALGMVWNSPVTSGIEKIARLHLRLAVRDPWMRKQLTPDFRPGCKRMLVSSEYYPALQKENCSLVTWPIATISPDGIRTSDGVEHQVDAIVFATGFDVGKAGTPFPVTGRGGRVLADEWTGGAYAYRSVTVSGYPNLFFTFGPNSGPGHNSALVYMESQIDYLVQAVQLLAAKNLRWMDVRRDVQDDHNTSMQKRLGRTTWNSGCSSWYLTEDGFNATMYPGFAKQYAHQLRRVRLSDYETETADVPVLASV